MCIIRMNNHPLPDIPYSRDRGRVHVQAAFYIFPGWHAVILPCAEHCEVRVWTVSAMAALGVPVFVGIEDHLSAGSFSS